MKIKFVLFLSYLKELLKLYIKMFYNFFVSCTVLEIY